MARRHTPYYHRFVELGADLGDRIGFDAAVRFSSTRDEHLATRERAGLYDVYYQGPIDIKGSDAEALLQKILVRDVERRLENGKVLYSSLCNDRGGMIDDLTCYRHSPEHFWLIATPARADLVAAWATEQAEGMHAYVTNTISGTGYLSLQGPRSREILSGIADADLGAAALPYFRFVETVVSEVPTLVSRTGYSGELGYELYYPRDYAEHMWDAVLAAGDAAGIEPCGLGALRSVRMEKAYPLYGLDVSEETSPLEAGLAWAVDLEKESFVGHDALLQQDETGLTRRLAGIEFPDAEFLPAIGDGVSIDAHPVGAVTSSDTGHFLDRTLALAYLPPDAVAAHSEVLVTSTEAGASATGTVTDRPFYDPEGARLRT
ncbi:MAG: aminomethyltransferase family protein [Actinomycetota bacterium]|nr:aminomethyltransferase family protein [Actinomycetota bacterium]